MLNLDTDRIVCLIGGRRDSFFESFEHIAKRCDAEYREILLTVDKPVAGARFAERAANGDDATRGSTTS